MGQAGLFLRLATSGRAHWCPGCERMHVIPSSWKFDGDLDKPSFKPSVNISWGKGSRCHYHVTKGEIVFQNDCTHALKGKTVPLPVIPPEHRDSKV